MNMMSWWKTSTAPKGHYDLLIRQGALIGLTADDFARVQPLRTSMATFYGWKWITRAAPWQDGLVAMMATEWVNDDRRLHDQGGGLSRRDGLRWIRDFGYKWEEMPNFAAHAVADEKHSDLFVRCSTGSFLIATARSRPPTMRWSYSSCIISVSPRRWRGWNRDRFNHKEHIGHKVGADRARTISESGNCCKERKGRRETSANNSMSLCPPIYTSAIRKRLNF